MVRKSKRTPEVKSKITALRKFSKFDIKNNQINGTVEVFNYRQYDWGEEVDIIFTGEIKVRTHFSMIWVNSEDANIEKYGRISKIKLNKFIRRNCLKDISRQMKYFGINIPYIYHIKKVIWK